MPQFPGIPESLQGPLQENILTLVSTSDEFCRLVVGSVPLKLYSNDIMRDIAVQAYNYVQEYSKAPKDHLYDLLESTLHPKDKEDAKATAKAELTHGTLDNMRTLVANGFNPEFVRNQLVRFVRQQSLKAAVTELFEAAEGGDVEKADDVIDTYRSTTYNQFESGLRLVDYVRVMDTDRRSQPLFELGIASLDRAGLGPARKELHYFMAPAKRGKCIHGDSLVLLADGRRRTIADIVKSRDDSVVLSFTGSGFVKSTVKSFWANGVRPCVRVRTKLGREIITTKEHLYFTERIGWLPVEHLRVERDRIAVVSRSSELQWLFDTVETVEPAGDHETYDLSVRGFHNFLANDIVTHNSWYGVHCVKQALLHRLRTLVITLELSSEVYASRLLQSFFSMTQNEVKVSLPHIVKDSRGGVQRIELQEMAERLAIYSDKGVKKVKRSFGVASDKKRENMERGLSQIARVSGNLIIQQFPTGQLRMKELVGYLDNLVAFEKFMPDVVVLDYPDLMAVDPRNFRLNLGLIKKELRGLAVDRNFALIAMAQSNRGSLSQKRVLTEADIAEDFSTAAITDTLITYAQLAAEKEMRSARLWVAVARNSRDKFPVFITQGYDIGQFFLEEIDVRQSEYDKLLPKTSGRQDDFDEDDKDDDTGDLR